MTKITGNKNGQVSITPIPGKTSVIDRISLFLTRVQLFFKYFDWFSEHRVKLLIKRFQDIPPGNAKVAIYDKQTEKVIDVLERMSQFYQLDETEKALLEVKQDPSPSFHLLDRVETTAGRLLFQIQADEFGANNENLEGYSQAETVSYLSDYLNKRQRAGLDLYGIEDSILREITVAARIARTKNLTDFIHLIRREIENSQENVLIPGGWVGTPAGHAMNYEVIPETEGKVTFRIYNLGAGSPGTEDPVSYKKKAPPYIDFKGVSRKTLTDKEVLQAIFELTTHAYLPHTTTKTEYNEKDIYEGLRDLLQPESVSYPSDAEVKTTQRSGVCSWRSLMAFLASRMPRHQYKRFACDIRLQSLLHRNWNLINSLSEVNLLQKSIEKIARKVGKLFQEKIIGQKYLHEAEYLLRNVENKLKEHKISIWGSPISSKRDRLKEEPLQRAFMVTGQTPLSEQIQGKRQAENKALNRELIHQIVQLPIEEAIIGVEKAIQEREFQTAHMALQRYIGVLDEKADLASLNKISQLYFDTCFLVPEASTIHTERIKNFEKLLQVQMAVAEKINPDCKKIGFYLGIDSIFFNPNAGEKNWVDPAREIYLRPTFLDYKPIGSSSAIYFHESSIELLDYLSSTHQKLLKDRSYRALKKDQQMAKLYMSNETPLWFQSIRNTSLFLHYISHEPVATPPNSLSTSFHVKFEISDFSKNMIYISVKEISGDILTNYPEIKENRETKEFHFASLYRKPLNPEIRKFLKYIASGKNRNEKELITIQAKKHNITLSDEWFKELAHIFLNKISEGFEYFYRHPEKLADPDYQTLFEIFFFNDYRLNVALKQDFFGLKINQFLRDQIHHGMKTNEIQKTVFLIRMSRLMHVYHEDVADQSELLKTLLERKGLEPEEKSAIYGELIAGLGKKQELLPDEVEHLILGSSFLNEHPVPDKWKLPQQNKEVREATLFHDKIIRDSLKGAKGEALLNRMVQEIYQIDEQYQWKADPFETADGQIAYDVNDCKVFAKNLEVALPLEILQHPHFRMNFKGITRAKHSPNHIYTFTDKGCMTHIKMVKGQLIIEQFKEGAWRRFVPRETFIIPDEEKRKTQLISRHLLQEYSHWQNLKSPSEIHLVHLKSGKTEYKVLLKGNYVRRIEKCSTSLTLKAPSKLLQRFESEDYIQEWGSLIELPRFDLSFKNISGKWICEKWNGEGFFIAEKQSLPLMGSYPCYLVLENGVGKKKLLLPEFQIGPPREKNAIFPDFAIDCALAPENQEPQSYLVFDINQEGLAENKSNSAKITLAATLVTVQEYETAAFYLRKWGPKLTPYTEKEKKALVTIARMGKITGDGSGNGLAFQSYALFLLMKNSPEYNVQQSDIEVYKKYLGHLKNATALTLSKEEELFLLKVILSKSFDSLLFFRLEKLDPAYAKKIQIQESKTPVNGVISLESAKINKVDNEGKFPLLKEILITRINNYLFANPLHFFTLSENPTPEEKKWLENALTFGKRINGQELSFIFSDILKHREQYPPFPPFIKSQSYSFQGEVDQWWNEVKRIASENTQSEREIKPEPQVHLLKAAHEVTQENKTAEKIPVNLAIQKIQSWSQISEGHFKTTAAHDLKSQDHRDWLAKERGRLATDPLYIKEIKRLQDDLIHEKGSVKHTLTDFNGLKELLHESENQLEPLEVALIELANCSAATYLDRLVEKIELKGKSRRALRLDDLMISFAKKDPGMLIAINPNLAGKTDEIYNKLGDYLILATHEQQRKRALNTLERLEKSEEEEQKDYEHELGLTLLTPRSYDPNEMPAYLVFEYYANVLMRQQQVIKLESFLKSGDTNHVMEMIMGSGKSKVLLPLLGLLKADGTKISMVIVPSPLFESVSSDTQNILSEAFSQSLKTLHFDRNTRFDPLTLHLIRDDLQEIISKKECLMVTSKSIQCLLLKFVEESCKQNGVLTEELTLLRDILNMITRSHPIIDEIDTVLNVLHEVCFSTGNRVTPKEDEIQLIAALYRILYTDGDIKKIIRIESDPVSSSGEELTEKNYHTRLKKLLARKVLKLERFKGVSNNRLALDYLCQTNISAAQSFFNGLTVKLQNDLSLASEQITHFLPHTLTRNCEEKYGLDLKNGGSIAIPYAAANTPNEGSQFANPYITMNYTFQYFVKKGISHQVLLNEVQRLQSKTLIELKEMGSGITIDKTEGFRLFQRMIGDLDLPLFNFNEKHLNLLLNKINSSVDEKLDFIQIIILPQLELSEKKLSCNPLNLITFFNSVSGFTGTLWNQESMHSKLKAFPDPGIDSKTLNILWKKSKEAIYEIEATSPEEIIKELHEKGIKYDLISDSGGYLKEGGNTEIAHQLNQFLKKPCIFYNKMGQQAIMDNGQEILLVESGVPLDERNTFLDQSHTTGADVPQRRDAIGLVTISRNMLLRDLLQTVWRLRGLDVSQSVIFIISQEVKGIINQTLNKETPIRFEDILEFTIINQTKQQGIDNFKGVMQEMQSLLQQLFFTAMLSEGYSDDQRQATVAAVENYWIKNTNQEPKDLYGSLATQEDSTVVIQEELKKFQNKVAELKLKLPFFDSVLTQVEIKIQELTSNLTDKLPAKILSPIREIDDDQTVEIEQETEQETQTELEVNESQESETIELGALYRPLKPVSSLENLWGQILTPFFSVKTYFESNPLLKEYAEAFHGVTLTLNVLQWPKKKPKVSDLKLFGPHRTPFHRILFQKNESIILSNYDYDFFIDHKYPSEFYNLGYGFNDPTKQLSPLELEQIIKIKFLNGESNYSKEEALILEAWIQKEGKEKMLKLFRDHILSGMPDKTSEYNSKSTLMKIFSKV